MLIDWFTVVAQIINFLILVVLLKIFLYERIIAVMDRRREQADTAFREAEDKQQQADEQRQRYEQRRRELDEQRDELLQEARDQARQTHDELLGEAREEVDRKRTQWRESLDRHKDQFLHQLRRQASRRLGQVARSALEDLADADLERQVVEVFLRRVEGLDPQRRRQAVEALQHGGPVTVHTAWELPDDQRDRVAKALVEQLDLGEPDAPSFETDEEIVCGIELRAGGFTVGWHVRQYVGELTDRVAEAIDEETGEPSAGDGASEETNQPAPHATAEGDAEEPGS